jgi:hypothetical protein
MHIMQTVITVESRYWSRYYFCKRHADKLSKAWLSATDPTEREDLKVRVRLAYCYWRRAALAMCIAGNV